MRQLHNLNPGPGTHNISNKSLWPGQSYTSPRFVCFFKGADICAGCLRELYGDYYRSSSGKTNLCLACFRSRYDPIRRKPSNYRKMRHCIAFHHHIDVENIVCNKTTSKRIRRLSLMEKRMWNKFGEMLDYEGKPI